MKSLRILSVKILFIGFFLLSFNSLLNAQWNVQVLNSGSSQILNTISSFDTSTIVAAGELGTILRSTDGGTTWNANNVSSSIIFYGSAFTPSGTGWLVGNAGTILKTTNSGLSWNLQNSGVSSVVTGIYAFDNQIVIAITSDGTVIKTTNGGTTWSLQATIPNAGVLRSVHFLDTQTGFIAGGNFSGTLYFTGGYVYKTTDGGTTWKLVFSSSRILTGVQAVSNTMVYTVGLNGYFYRSTDGGTNWSYRDPGTSDWLFALHFFSDNEGFILGGSSNYPPLINYTTNGTKWSTFSASPTYKVNSCSFPNINTGFCANDGGVLLKLTRNSNYLNLLSPNGSENLLIGSTYNVTWTYSPGISNLKIEYTTNNGTTWLPVISSTPASNGYYQWVIPVTPSTSCKVKISDASNPGVLDISDNTFTIYANHNITWVDTIHVSDNGSDKGNLIFGQSPIGSDSIDVALGESSLPPIPPAGVFDIRFDLLTNSGDCSLIDFRSNVAKDRSWLIKFQPGSGTYPFTFTWNPLLLPSGSFFLKDIINGTIVNVDMKSNNSYTLTNSGINALKIENNVEASSYIKLNKGWNIVSVPILQSDMNTLTLFPGYTSPTYKYNNGYQTVSALSIGLGYWVRYADSVTVYVGGSLAGINTIPVLAGWNMIGGYDKDITVSSLTTTPSGILTSSFYGFENGYVIPATLLSGKGYWIRASQNGVINIPAGLAKTNENQIVNSTIEPAWGRIVITDKNGNQGALYKANGNINLSNFDLPPVPPNGIFDVRFGSNRNVESMIGTKEIMISSASYPVTIRAEGMDIRIKDVFTGKLIDRVLKNGENFIIDNNAINTLSVMGIDVPQDYCLYQNYPNPFNPSTTIKFGLPIISHVKITIYNQLGEKVEVLLDKDLEAGLHAVSWNAGNMASGLYFYEMKTDKYTSVKKLVLMK
ncbi:MAG: YCF48-related protein [Ignavibacteriaceae bacterium]|nr:YCF48-related protein [Ignavibacteriaceae bacterium]